jgi:hypothetical protein
MKMMIFNENADFHEERRENRSPTRREAQKLRKTIKHKNKETKNADRRII